MSENSVPNSTEVGERRKTASENSVPDSTEVGER